MQIGQADNDVYLNDLYNAFRSCWGGNRDQSALYTQNIYCSGTRLHHNWVHDSYAGTPPLDWGGGMAIRGDDNTTGLTVDHNVVWNIGSTGLELKNPNNATADMANGVYNNTVFQHSTYNPVKSAMIVRTKLNNENKFSSVVNNMAQTIYGDWYGKALGTIANYSNNSTDKVTESNLENPSNFDFRPKLAAVDILNKGKIISEITNSVFGSAPDIGAYERGDSIYWIPGRREFKASFPIVPDGASVQLDRDVLIWRQAYKAISHQVYFGTNKESLELKARFSGEKNVYALPKLAAGVHYFWRIDAVIADGSTVKGDIWSFTTTSTITGITTMKNEFHNISKVNIYPNPTRSTITLEGLNNKLWIIRDITGQQISAGFYDQIDLSFYKTGMYLMSIENSTYKIIKL